MTETPITKCRVFCSVPLCHTRGGKMYKFPKNPAIRELWKLACRIEKPITDSMCVCARHFRPSDFSQKGGGRTRVVNGAKPTLYLPETVPKTKGHCVDRCIVPTCGKRWEDGVTLHSFPRLYERRVQWQKLCSVQIIPSRHTLICSRHFLATDFRVGGKQKILRSFATPSQNLPGDPTVNCGSNDPLNTEPQTPKFASDSVYIVPHFLDGPSIKSVEESSVIHGEAPHHQQPESSNCFVQLSCKVEEVNPHIEDCLQSSNDFQSSEYDVSPTEISERNSPAESMLLNQLGSDQSKDTLHSSDNCVRLSVPTPIDLSDPIPIDLSEPSASSSSRSDGKSQTDLVRLCFLNLVKDDSQMKGFTGVSFATLSDLTDLVLDLCKDSSKSELSMKERIVLTLCKLRLNLPYECLGALFSIDRHLCETLFSSTIHLLALVLKAAVHWPSRTEVKRTMPKCFQKFENTRVVLHCIEIPVESPNCLKCCAHLYSNYDATQTIKALVGIAPSGLITFISKVYEGKSSDKQIFEESDLIQKKLLDPLTDAIMVDKCCDIDEVCNEYRINMHCPPFVKEHIDFVNERNNSQIANTRVYVERAIQRLKTFRILQSNLTTSVVPHFDDIMTVLAGIVNLSSPALTASNVCHMTKT